MNKKCKEEAKTDSRYEQNRFARNGITTYKQKNYYSCELLVFLCQPFAFYIINLFITAKAERRKRAEQKATRARVSEQQKKEQVG